MLTETSTGKEVSSACDALSRERLPNNYAAREIHCHEYALGCRAVVFRIRDVE